MNTPATSRKAAGMPPPPPPRKPAAGRFFFFRYALLLLCSLALVLLALYAAVNILESCRGLISLEELPLASLLLTVLRQLRALLLPFAVPVLLALLLCFLLCAAKAVLTEERRYGRLGAAGKIAVSLDAFRSFFISLLLRLPEILMVLVVAVGLNSLLLGINRFRRVADDLRRIQELGVMVKNLSRVEDIAQVTMLSQRNTGSGVEKTYRIEILSEDGEVVSQQTVTLPGSRIAIDSITVNFDYSQIESGQQKNIAYPYRVYSERMKPDDAVPLTCMFNDEQLPVIYCLEASSIYGMEQDAFFLRLKELFGILKDEKRSRELGIRSVNGTVNHVAMNQGDVWRLSVEATGGLSIRRKKSLGEAAAF